MSRLEQLTERQRQCLRLYYANFEIKEIAAEIGLSPHTVKEHLRDARALLGTPRSMGAARLLVAHEQDTWGVPPPKRIASAKEFSHEAAAEGTANCVSSVRNRYNLGVLTRIGLIIAIAFGAVALTGALLVGAEAITRLFVGHGIDISDPPYRQ